MDAGSANSCDEINCGAAPCKDGKCQTKECKLHEKDFQNCIDRFGVGYSDYYSPAQGCSVGIERKLCKEINIVTYCCSPSFRPIED
jgi:hypothetical protein